MLQRVCLRRFAGLQTSSTRATEPRRLIANWSTELPRHHLNTRPLVAEAYKERKPNFTHASQSSVSSTTFAVTAVGLALSATVYLYSSFSSETTTTNSTALESCDLITAEGEGNMAGTIQPGRPGNLTPEQEVKLQEFWKAALKIFGVPLDDVAGLSESVNGLAVDGEEEEEQGGEDKGDEKKKKRKSLFSRKRKDTKSKADEVAAPQADSDDKYGQTKEFHDALATNSPEDLRKAFWEMVKHDHPDGLMLRFLRARKWDIEKALVMMISTMHWRLKEMHVDDDIVIKGEGGAVKDAASSDKAVQKEAEDFMTQLRLGKSFLHGADKEGRPMCIVRARLHRQGEQTEQSLERFTVHVIETARLLLSPPVDTATIIFDMTDFSMANMDYAPVKFMIKVFEANYPESLGVVLVHKAPWIFNQIWRLIKGWLDPVVAGKVHFTNNVNDLSSYIDKSQIIKSLDGEEDWEYKYVEPIDGENSKLEDTATRDKLQKERLVVVDEFEEATKEWIHKQAGDKDAPSKRNALADKLKKGYWDLDPYVRARSLYDRTGVITEHGQIQFYPKEAAQATQAKSAVETNADDLD